MKLFESDLLHSAAQPLEEWFLDDLLHTLTRSPYSYSHAGVPWYVPIIIGMLDYCLCSPMFANKNTPSHHQPRDVVGQAKCNVKLVHGPPQHALGPREQVLVAAAVEGPRLGGDDGPELGRQRDAPALSTSYHSKHATQLHSTPS